VARIEIERLGKRFGDVEVLRDLSLDIADGSIAALLGPSGCGKSTTLYILAGLYQPSAGDVRFDGASVIGLAPRDRNVGLVFQSYALYPHLDVRGNIAFPLVLQRAGRAEIARRVAEAADLAGLTDLLDRKPAQLSGGQQQRVAVARAIVKRPRLLLMDEPLSNLDQELRARMRREIKRVQRETGITTIIVTHDQEEAMSLADEIFVLQSGRLQQSGDHRQLYDRPANRFVAGFIGTPSMNFFDQLTLTRDELGAGWIESRGRRLLPVAPGSTLARPERIEGAVLGVRPEHVRLTPVSGDGAGAPGRVADLVPLGRELLVVIELDADLELRALVPASTALRAGDPVRAAIDEASVHLFDAASGETRPLQA
jgi:ABC-type sugar transport system ATPase subunit